MKFIRALAGVGALVAGVLGVSSEAKADPMDPTLERLVLNPECKTTAGAVQLDGNNFVRCQADDVAFKRLMNQWGWAIAPSAMHSARTTGFGGFHLSLQMGLHDIDEGADYWKRGTEGPRDPSTDQASIVNSEPDSVLQIYSVKIRKSFRLRLGDDGHGRLRRQLRHHHRRR